MSNHESTAPASATRGLERRSIEWIPHEERHGKLWHQGPLWFLGNFQYFTIAIGFIGPSLGLSLGWSIAAGALGILVGTAFMAFHASQGPGMGLPQMIQSRAQFGYRGVVVPVIAALFTYLAFNIVDSVLLGAGFDAAFHISSVTSITVATIAAALLGIFGHDWLHTAFRGLLVVLLPLTILLTIGILTGHAGAGAVTTAHSDGFVWMGFLAQFTAGAAYNITYAPYVSDYSRYLPADTRPLSIIGHVFFGAASSAIWLIAIGAWLATRLGVTDGLLGLQQAGNSFIPHLGDATAIFSVLAMIATMGMNAYGGALTTLTAIDVIRPLQPKPRHRVAAVLVLTVIWYAISLAIGGNAVETVSTGLTLMLYLLVPWTATNLVDYFLVRKGHYDMQALFDPRGCYGSWSWRGLSAFTIGLVAEAPFMVLPGLYTGPVAHRIGDADVSWMVGLLVSGLVYGLVARPLRVQAAAPLITGESEILQPAA